MMMSNFTFAAFLFTWASLWAGPAADNPLPSCKVQMLLQARDAYKKIAASQTWSDFPKDICLRPGETNQLILKLRNNLLLTGDLKSLGTWPFFLFDDTLVVALKKFQQRHGLKPDGVAGPNTLAALNVSPQQRVQQIELNLDRWRQIPFDAYPLVLVNIPDFTLQLFDNAEEVVWQTRVIVGQTAKAYQTALLDSKISYLVLNPTWNLPQSIIRNEIIPLQQHDPAYLARNHMSLYRMAGSRQTPLSPHTINWNKADPARDKFMVIQQAGPHNALGKIKFIFANPFDQYLHDTPAKSLFNHPVRTYSHGCVRVQHPDILATYLLNLDWELPLKTAALPKSRTVDKIIYLPAPVNIKIGYFTAWVDENGVLQFRPDIYRLDKQSRLPDVVTVAGIPSLFRGLNAPGRSNQENRNHYIGRRKS
jgi:L,D-transpeptidase YcbB